VTSHDDLGVLAGDVLLEVVLTEENPLGLGVVVEVESHLADTTLEAELVEDTSPGLYALSRVHRLATYVTLLSRHCKMRDRQSAVRQLAP